MNSLLITVLLFAPLAALHAAEASSQKPNIIVIMADDLSHRNLGCYGAVNFETPHLDKLAAGGMRLTIVIRCRFARRRESRS